MPKLTFVIGAAGTGKTWFIDQKFRQSDVDILNVYDYQQRVYDEAGLGDFIPMNAQFRCLMRANALLLEDILEKLAAGRNVVVEQTFYKAKRRIAYIDEVRKIPGVTIEVYVMCPSDTLWQANLKKRELGGSFQSYKRDFDLIEFPNVSEGFDAIYQVTDDKITWRMDPPQPEILAPAMAALADEAEKIRLEDEAKQKRAELLESMKTRRFWHYCEVCGKKEYITAKEAFDNGWDYPPDLGNFGLLSPRTCVNCLLKDTLYAKITFGGGLPIVCEDDLAPEELITWRRIRGEPESLLSPEE